MKSRMSFRGNEMVMKVDSKYMELLLRNDALACEITRLQMENRNIQKKYNALIIKQILPKPTTVEVATQTDQSIALENVHQQQQRKADFLTPLKEGDNKTVPIPATKVSPTQYRVGQQLSDRIEREKMEKFPSAEISSGNETVEETEDFSRTKRNRKEVVYTEPSLKVKVRKGFKFFQSK